MDVISRISRARFACALAATLFSIAEPVSADEPAHASGEVPARVNRPPEFDGEAGSDRRTQHVHVRTGDKFDFPIAVRDPNGDPITLRVGPLPPFAAYDERAQILSFSPKLEHTGKHAIELEASDGTLTARRSLRVIVTMNQAPQVNLGPTTIGVDASTDFGAIQLFSDSDGESLKVVSQSIPKGSRIVLRGSSANLEWRPTEADLGVHPIDVVVTDGDLTAELHTEITVVPEWMTKKWSSALLPIAGPTAFMTRERDLYAGGRFDFAFFAHRRARKSGSCTRYAYESDCYANQLRLYAGFEVLDAPSAELPALFTYALGYTGSFSQAPRRALLPFFSVEAGGLYQSGLGHRVQTRPELGVFLWSDESVWIDAAVGLRLVPAELATLSGPTFALRVQLNPW